MEPNRLERLPGTGNNRWLGPPDPQFVEAVRSVLAHLASEQHPTDAPLADPTSKNAKTDEAKKPRRVSLPSWQLVGALLVVVVAFVGMFIYMRLTRDLGSSRKELGRLRRELGLLRTEVVRKEEFNSRNLSAHALIREAQLSGRMAADAGLQRQQEQNEALAELRLLLEDLQRDAKRFRERLPRPDQTPAGKDASPNEE
jgi:hypothetical protein